MSRRIALFGGSFNPTHIGHVAMCLQGLIATKANEVLIMPCYLQEGKTLLEYKHRVAMAKLAFADVPYARVSTLEEELGGVSYTYRTLEALRDLYLGDQIVLLLGEDLRDKVAGWKNWDQVSSLPKREVTIEFLPRTNISSSEIRRWMDKRKFVDAWRMLPTSVLQYICDNRLYCYA